MPNDEDKYPESSGRRRFVKGVVGSAALGGVGVGSTSVVNVMTSPTGEGGGTTQYFGVENIAGPAPRAMPQVPVEIDADGFLKGLWPEVKTVTQQGREVQVAETQLGGITYSSEWYQYCGVQSYPGIDPNADQDNFFRYADAPPYQWQQEEVSAGDKVSVDDFGDYQSWGNDIGQSGLGKPAMATWRSQDVGSQGVIPVQIIRSSRIEEEAQNNQWLSASTSQGFLAILNKCTHFCCVPGFKADAVSAKFGGSNDIYCPCHQSVYDPFTIVKKSFVALPRPSGGGGQ